MEITRRLKDKKYQSIPNDDNELPLSQQHEQATTKKITKYIIYISFLFLFGLLSNDLMSIIAIQEEKTKEAVQSNNMISLDKMTLPNIKDNTNDELLLPSGVNIGSWLSLEDYFFAGLGSVEIATPFNHTQGNCLPPLHTGSSTGPTWNSETDLLYNLWKSTSLPHALRVIHAHRTSYLDYETDLPNLSKLGVSNIRVPISWCLTDADPDLLRDDVSEEELLHKFTCRDPFHEGVFWPAIPKSLLQYFLQRCSYHGIKVVLDIHTYPGATSIGTFSGVWPKWPRFWTHGDLKEPDVGRDLLHDFIAYVESLHEVDPIAFTGIRAISIMNEPGHLMGLFNGPNPTVVDPSQPPFVPPLPEHLNTPFLNSINTNSPTQTIMPDGEHLRILYWLKDGITTFRESLLPSLGIECHVNIIESIFAKAFIKPNMMKRTGYIASFWRSVTTLEERKSWAIVDYHRYHAWDPGCQGSSDGINGKYTCSDIAARTQTLNKCTQWAKSYRSVIDKECGQGTKLVSAEFSPATHHSVRHACQDVSTLKASYEKQTKTALDNNIELFYWSYQMPYGGAFRNAWSFKQFLYLMGVWDSPDERLYDCGEHVAADDEPHDSS